LKKLANYFISFKFEKPSFLNESPLNLAYTHLYEWAKSDRRVSEGIVDVRFRRQSILSTIRLDGTQVPLVFEETLNGDFLWSMCKPALCPVLVCMMLWFGIVVHQPI
jgi:hypothetical protein